ncbi:hypothetical protein BJY04DRAFT_81461 [Aspergillus karnatakaensis]|uniref:uncharacterized protein n=1 Tax=Aspergillus karnatakaensis TaxID=1810916 RepID=UPI003CCCCAE7
MGQRHNRRRTRPRSKNSSANALPLPTAIAIPDNFCAASPSAYSFDCFGNRPVSSRHYRAVTWHDREHILKTESAMMETEQYRLFGGEPGDDVNLCCRMLEYFGGLDYIDP